MNEDQTLAEQAAGIARELTKAGDEHETLQRIVELAVDTIEWCDHAGVSMVVGDRIQTPAQSDEVPGLIDRIQVDVGEGPHRDASCDHEVFATGDLSREQRWGRFSTEVVARTGGHSMLAMRLFADEETMGSLNLYAEAVDAFDVEDHHVASIFAAHAAVALRAAQQQQPLDEELAGDDIDVIAEAKGLIMAHQDVDETGASETLRDTAHRTDRDLREAAEQVIDREQQR